MDGYDGEREDAVGAIDFVSLSLVLVSFVGHLVVVVDSLQQETVEMDESLELVPLLNEHSHELPIVSALSDCNRDVLLHEIANELPEQVTELLFLLVTDFGGALAEECVHFPTIL